MWRLILLSMAIILLVAFAAAFISSSAFKRANERLADTLVTKSQGTMSDNDTAKLEPLPAPVRRYLESVLPEGAKAIEIARLEQTGTFFLDGTWQPFTATQVDTTHPPGFVWDASIKAGPLLTALVVDYYVQGEGGLHAKLLGALTLMNSKGTQEADSGELMRYLAETPWYPTALLPGTGVTWTPLDDHSAEATLTDDDTTVSLTFHFNDANEIDVVEGLRYRETARGAVLTPWRGRFWNYAERGGVRVPLQGEVAWILPDGEAPYWRGTVEAIHFEPTDTSSRLTD